MLDDFTDLIKGLDSSIVGGWLELAGAHKTTVLITGPIGSGKTRLASHLMATAANKNSIDWSKRQQINLATIPSALAELELFGTEGEQFTGDSKRMRKGIIETADKSALFLDEVHLASLPVQAKLLRVIETKMLRRMGATSEKAIDVWFIAASSKPAEIIPELAYRLAGVHFEVTALADRRGEIIGIARRLLEKWLLQLRRIERIPVKDDMQNGGRVYFDAEVEEELCRGEWPGNIRQLDSLMMRVAMCSSCEPRCIGMDLLKKARTVELDERLFHKAGTDVKPAGYDAQELPRIWTSDQNFVAWMEKMIQHSDKNALPTEGLCRAVLAHAYKKRFSTYKVAAKYLGVRTDSTVMETARRYDELLKNKFADMESRTRSRTKPRHPSA